MSYISRLLGARDVNLPTVLDEMRFLETEKIGPTQSLTPEGFLLVRGTPVARTGWQIYAPQEIPESERFTPPPDGVFRVWRDEKEVFRPDAIASANGKPVVDEHPDEIITPETVGAGAPGVALDPRRGEGVQDDFLIMDLLVYSKSLIDSIRDGKREISLGYDVEYEELEPGKLAQKNIIVNHIALVDSGRCGPRCVIRDRSTTLTEERPDMAKKSVMDRIRRVLSSSSTLPAKDKEELEKALEGEEEVDARSRDEEGSGHTIEVHNHMPASAEPMMPAEGDTRHRDMRHRDEDPDEGEGDLEERVARLETAIHELAEMVKAGMGGSATSDDPASEVGSEALGMGGIETDETVGEGGEKILGELEFEAPTGAESVDVRSAKDSRFLAESFQTTSAIAEILAPGIRIPAFDKKSAPKLSFDAICSLRREALEFASRQPETSAMIRDVLNGRALDKKMTCGAIRSTFMAVGAMKRNANNSRLSVGDASAFETRSYGQALNGGIKSLRDLNKMYKDHYEKNGV